MSTKWNVVGGGTQSEKRQRADGTWTYTTPEWDADWYWPVGTRIQFKHLRGVPKALQGVIGTVIKTNPTTVSVRTDVNTAWGAYSDRTIIRVSFTALERLS